MQRLKKTVDMTEGPFLKKMIMFAIPLVLTGILQSFYNAADLVVVGQFRGDLAVAAVGTTGSLTNLVIGLFMGFSVGAGVCVAHHIGAKEDEDVKKVVHTSILLATILGVVIAVFGFFFSKNFLELMDVPADVLPLSTLYLKIIFLGVPASMLYNYVAAILRSSGDSKRPLIFLAIAGVVNIVLNVFLVVVFNMNVEGVAIATIVSQYLSAIMAIVYLFKTEGILHVSLADLRIDSVKVKRILYIGVPSGIQSSLFSLSNVLIQSSINSFGDATVAGSAASGSIEGFMYIAMNAIYHVALTFIGQSVGARKYKNIRRLTFYSAFIVTGVGVISAILVLIFHTQLIGLYVSSEAAMQAAMERMWIIVPTYFICGLMEVFCAGLRALDRSVTAMVISLAGACGLRILWIETVFKYLYMAPQGIYISYPVSWTVTALFHLLFMIIATRRIMKNSKKDMIKPTVNET